MPRLAICSRDLHWHWINRTLLCDTMQVSMLSRAWLTIAQHVFQPALTGRPLSRWADLNEKLSPTNWVQGVTEISGKKIALLGAKKIGSNMRPRYIQFCDIHDRDISGVHCIGVAPGLKGGDVGGDAWPEYRSLSTCHHWRYSLVCSMESRDGEKGGWLHAPCRWQLHQQCTDHCEIGGSLWVG